MKVSLQIRDNGDDQQQRKPLLRAKVPISVLGLPFTSGVVAGDASDLSFSLQTNFLSGPSLKLSYNPYPLPTAAAAPFALSLKSGAGLFGSPNDSPLTISARCSLLPNSINPSFSLYFKPRFGHFSLNKAAFSPNPNPNNNSPSPNLPNPSSFGMTENAEDELGPFEMLDSNLNPTSKLAPGSGSALAWKDLKKMESSCCGRDGILSGFAVRARTVLPLVRGVDVNFRWGLDFPAQIGKTRKMPFLTVDKIRIERRTPEDGKDNNSSNNNRKKNNDGDMELLKGMCLWMSRDLKALQKENREIKQCLQELRSSVVPARSYNSGEIDGAAAKKLKPSLSNKSSEFEQWRDWKKNGDGQEIRESSKRSCHP